MEDNRLAPGNGRPRRIRFTPLIALIAGLPAVAALTPDGAGAGAPDSAPMAEVTDPTPIDAVLGIALDPALEPARGAPDPTGTFRVQPAPFSVRVNGQAVPHAVLALSVLPGEAMELELGEGVGPHELLHAAGTAAVVDNGSEGGQAWRWNAPTDPGIYALQITGDGVPAPLRINVFVLHPSSHVENEALHGFRIGRYAEKPLGGRAVYLPPEGFVRVSPGDENVLVSPHFTLGQFLSKQQGEPRFVAFSPSLVLKLEAVLETVNESGIAAGTFHVMSGFRTPWYNRAIGNTTIYSRHLWGDAADIFIDRDGNGDMDDLNGDGRRDVADARHLAKIVEGVEGRGREDVLPGGVGVYRRNAAHGPFVHVDARGYTARW